MTKAKVVKSVKKGIWTPNAQIICYDCHGNKFPDTKQMNDGTFDWGWRSYGTSTWEKLRDLHILEEGNGLTLCDKCGCSIQIEEGLAREHNLAMKLQKLGINANMTQTGGMCSACEVTRTGPKAEGKYSAYYLVTYNWDGDDGYFIGCYDNQGDWDENEGASFKTMKEVIEYFKGRTDVERIDKDGKCSKND